MPKTVKKAKIHKFKDKLGKERKLTPKQKKFADLFVSDLSMSGTDAVIKAGYDLSGGKDKRKLAAVIASENLTKPDIYLYIETKLDESGLNDSTVDKHHLFTLSQMTDIPAKNRAIDIYHRKQGKYAPEKHEHKVTTVKVVKYAK